MRGMTGPRSVVLVEGLPGSGKTTTSRQIAAAYRHRGESCAWILEEAKDHPLFGADVRSRHRQPDYDAVCLAQWARLQDPSDGPQRLVLDGCALQSTVRFMFEQNWPMSRIETYWRRFQYCVAPIPVAFVYLQDPDPESFIRDHVTQVRSDVWQKIVRHVEQTPMGRVLIDGGFDASVEFWVRYRQVCDALVAQTELPLLVLDISAEWDDVTPRIMAWLDQMDDQPSE
jgi:hypothetical protein